MLGHSTGRLLLRREGYAVDLDAVLAGRGRARDDDRDQRPAARGSISIGSIASEPRRWAIKLVINPDAHRTGELELFTYGVDVARRGWLEKGDVFNTQSLRQIEQRSACSAASERRAAGGAVPRRTCVLRPIGTRSVSAR